MISRRHLLKGFSAVAFTAHQVGQAMAQDAGPGSALGTGTKGVMLMNRIGPSASELYVANSDGTGERKLLVELSITHNFCPHMRAQFYVGQAR